MVTRQDGDQAAKEQLLKAEKNIRDKSQWM